MIRFHNRVVDTLPGSVPTALRFSTARELVTKHYQWMLRTDFLPRICAASIVDDELPLVALLGGFVPVHAESRDSPRHFA